VRSERAAGHDRNAAVEEAVAAHPVPLEGGCPSGDQEGRITLRPRAGPPGGLARRVIGHLVLEENVGPGCPVPDHLVLLEVLDEQPVSSDVVPVDDDAGVRGIGGPADPAAMVSPPGPDVIEDHFGAVDHEAGGRLAGRGTADAEEHVLHYGRVRCGCASGARTAADLEQYR